VLGVFTGADCAADKLAPIPHDPVPKTKFDMKLHAPGGGAVFAIRFPTVLAPKTVAATRFETALSGSPNAARPKIS